MTTERNFVIRKVSFVLDSAHRTHAFDDEAIQVWCILEPLLAAPLKVVSSEYLEIKGLM